MLHFFVFAQKNRIFINMFRRFSKSEDFLSCPPFATLVSCMAQEFWINLSRVDLFPVVVQNDNKLQVCHKRPRLRARGVSNSPPTSYETPYKVFMNQANPDCGSPAPFFCGAIYLPVRAPPTNNYTGDWLQLDPHPSERQGGRMGKSISSNGHTA